MGHRRKNMLPSGGAVMAALFSSISQQYITFSAKINGFHDKSMR
jgi:exopolyphosphatase/pppGpp-phosphohydrolase